MASVELRNLSKTFRRTKTETVDALSEVSLSIADGECVTVMGPSGSGKTTLLRLIAGLEQPTEGDVFFDGIPVTNVAAHQRDVAMVQQSPALLPHLTVRENVTLGLRLRNVASDEITARLAATAERLGIKRFFERLPSELSGGERQRVSLARALMRQPKVFLLDEPFSGLDGPLRLQLRGELAQVQRELGVTMIHVTHDHAEATSLGSRVLVLRGGAVQQFASPENLFAAPANAFIAGMVGVPPMNLMRGHVARRGDEFFFTEHNVAGAVNGKRMELVLDAERGARLAIIADGNVLLGIRPENVRLDNSSACRAHVELVELLGGSTILRLNTGATRFTARVEGNTTWKAGDTVGVMFDQSRAVFFNPVSERVIAL